jgi:cytochrome c oxidase subunit I+III
MVLAQFATGSLGFGVWVHHMFATGIPQLGSSFFTAASIMIVIPTGVQFFCWISTLWNGALRLTTAMLFTLGFFAVFLVGGLSGVILASVPIDLQVHDTFFVVAHLHYVLIGGSVFPLLGAVYFWFPKMSGRRLNERWGLYNFLTFFLGFNLVFFPLHRLGLLGMPRRVYTYAPDRGWETLNALATLGVLLLAVSVILLLVNVVRSLRKGEPAGDDPWEGHGLEWAASSPPESYNFALLPTVSGRYALWTRHKDQPVVTGVRSDRPEVLVTQLMDAEPDHRTELPGPSVWPLLTALALGVLWIGSIFTPWAVPVGALLTGLGALGWFWPKKPHREELAPQQP